LFRIELVTRECLNNAVIHGNRSDPLKQVTFELHGARKWIRISVRDEGPGFNWRRRCRAVGRNENEESGRGTTIVALYAARTRYNRCGNEITVWFQNNFRKKD
jgi:anti-sigma regulatory factor (Ser/Thr protein kinase)